MNDNTSHMSSSKRVFSLRSLIPATKGRSAKIDASLSEVSTDTSDSSPVIVAKRSRSEGSSKRPFENANEDPSDHRREPSEGYIDGKYRYDYDIRKIHARILLSFEMKQREYTSLQKDLERMNWIIENIDDTVETIMARSMKRTISKKMKEIEDKELEKVYMKNVEGIIQDYSSITPEKRRVFGRSDEELEDEYTEYRLVLIARYLKIACQYYDVRVTKVASAKEICSVCNSEYEFIYEGHCDGMVCSSCGLYKDVIEDELTFKDAERVNCGGKSSYDRRKNFEETIMKYQGKQKSGIPVRVDAAIREYVERYNLSLEKIDKGTLHMIMKENRLSEFYDDINLIHYEYTRSPLPDISEYEERLLYRHELVEKVYNKILDELGERRTNFLNNQFVLRALLEMEGYRVNASDFSSLKTRDVIVAHNKIMKAICDRLFELHPDMNWDFRPI